MTNDLISRAELARRAGVAASSVTKACETTLKRACAGRKVDANHPDVIAYIQRRERAAMEPSAPGLDPYYEEAVDVLRGMGNPTPKALRAPLGIGSVRAAALFKTIQATGVLTKPAPPPEPEPEPAPAAKPPRKPSGWTARREKQKQEAAAAPPEILEVPEDIQAFADMSLRELVERFGTDVRFLDWLKATKAIEDINEKRLKNAETRGDLVSRQMVRQGILDPIESAHVKLLTDGSKTIARRATAMHGSGRDMEDIEKFVADQVTSFLRPMKAKIKRTLKNA